MAKLDRHRRAWVVFNLSASQPQGANLLDEEADVIEKQTPRYLKQSDATPRIALRLLNINPPKYTTRAQLLQVFLK